MPLLCGSLCSHCAEVIVHSINSVFDEPGVPSAHKSTLLLDFLNAFNSIDCGLMFEEVRAHIPSLAAWLESCCSGHSLLHLGSHIMHSYCEVQLGKPFGTPGFCSGPIACCGMD